MFSLLVAMVALSLLLVAANPAHAKTFTVNYTGDAHDSNTADDVCDITGLVFACSLRAAIQQANATDEVDTINFNMLGDGVKTIKPSSELPEVTDEVTIDGYSQSGASPNTLATGTNAVLKIQLDGIMAGPTSNGIVIQATDSVIRGLVINRFGGNAILMDGLSPFVPQGNRVEGNFLGTDPSGTLDRGNGSQGVSIHDAGSSGNAIGGTTPAARNLISGNDNGGVGIVDAADTVVRGNLIGTKKDGSGALGNSAYGVRIISGSLDNVVGGNTSTAANTIAFNGEDGVEVVDGFGSDSSTGNSILRNSIFQNDALGIDLLGGVETFSGVTANDNKDTDTGPNNLQNFPVLTSAVTTGGSTTIEGKLNSTPNKTFKVQFFSNPPGSSEGKKYIGQKNVSTNANGNTGTYSFSPAQAVPDGQAITATATDPNGNTSEFSAPEEVV